jgi:hypothetical protein
MAGFGTTALQGKVEKAVAINEIHPLRQRLEQIRRLVGNVFYATGITGSVKKTVPSRIYMSYVAGWCVAACRFFLKREWEKS